MAFIVETEYRPTGNHVLNTKYRWFSTQIAEEDADQTGSGWLFVTRFHPKAETSKTAFQGKFYHYFEQKQWVWYRIIKYL